MDAVLSRKCPTCGQRIEINEPREYSRALKQHMMTVHPVDYARSKKMRKILLPLLFSCFILPFIPLIFQSEIGALTPVISVAGFVTPLAIVVVIGRRSVKRSHYASPTTAPSQQYTSSEPSTGPVESGASYTGKDILGIARDLGQRLEIRDNMPTTVSWQDYFIATGFAKGRSRPVLVPYDGCRIQGSQIILPESTRSKLQPEEWAPLIASELIYRRKLLEKRAAGLLLRIVPLTALYIIIPIILWQTGILVLQGTTTVRGSPTTVAAAFFEVYTGTALVLAMLLYIILGLRFDRKMRLKADTMAAALTGKAIFLTALEKIGAAFPELMTKGRPSIQYPPGRPTIAKRIEIVQEAIAF